jgi:16S rRNA C1402 N4-methylase RsmH
LVFRGSRKPSAAEVAANRRAEAARLRAIVRTEADPD